MHPLVAVAHRRALQQPRVTAGGLGFGHREARAHRAVRAAARASVRGCTRDRSSPCPPPAVRRCRCRARCCRRPRGRRGLAEDLVHQARLHLTEAHAAQFGGQVRGPEPALTYFVLEGLDERDAWSWRGRGSRWARSPRARTRRIHANFSSNSGSVSKSHAIGHLPSLPTLRRAKSCSTNGRKVAISIHW